MVLRLKTLWHLNIADVEFSPHSSDINMFLCTESSSSRTRSCRLRTQRVFLEVTQSIPTLIRLALVSYMQTLKEEDNYSLFFGRIISHEGVDLVPQSRMRAAIPLLPNTFSWRGA
jgi:hypothetical protein